MTTNSYLLHDDNDDWFALLPNHQYKKIPYINWVEDVDWTMAYYKVYKSLLHGIISDLDLFNWDIQKNFGSRRRYKTLISNPKEKY